jgi:hypothetical protein
MADGANSSSGNDHSNQDRQAAGGDEPTDIQVELVDSLPGGRAVVGVEQHGRFVWLADRHHVSEQARDEFAEQLQRIVRERWWVQNWPGVN